MKAVLKIFYTDDNADLSFSIIGTPVIITPENINMLKNNIKYIEEHIDFVKELRYNTNSLDVLEKYQNEYWFYKEYSFYKTEDIYKFKITEKEYNYELLQGNININKILDKNYAKWYIKLKNINDTYDVVSSIWSDYSQYIFDIVLVDEK